MQNGEASDQGGWSSYVVSYSYLGVFLRRRKIHKRLHVLLVETVDGISLSERVQRPEDPVVN